MTEGDRLGTLEMRVARHDGFGVLLRLVAEHVQQFFEVGENLVSLLAKMQANVERHLIVAAAGSVQALAGAAETGGKFAFHEGVNVLGFHIDLKNTAFDVRENALQAIDDLVRLGTVDDAAGAEHIGMRHAALDVLAEHAAVEGNG